MPARATYAVIQRVQVYFEADGQYFQPSLSVNQARSLYYALRDALREAGEELA